MRMHYLEIVTPDVDAVCSAFSAANNLGAETRIEYAPSTKFYLDDRDAGRPWITRLPFPVHVVERVVVCHHV